MFNKELFWTLLTCIVQTVVTLLLWMSGFDRNELWNSFQYLSSLWNLRWPISEWYFQTGEQDLNNTGYHQINCITKHIVIVALYHDNLYTTCKVLLYKMVGSTETKINRQSLIEHNYHHVQCSSGVVCRNHAWRLIAVWTTE